MKKIFVTQKAKVTPKEVLDEIDKFEYVNKSPYSKSCYNSKDIDWNYKPEGSLRISDHWNFKSRGEKHCLLAETDEFINNYWMLARYENGKYNILKKFGPSVCGYRLIEVSKNDLYILKCLYDIGGISDSKVWRKNHKEKLINFVKEAHTKDKKSLLKYIGAERVNAFKEQYRKSKKVIFIEEQYMEMVKKLLILYEKASELEELSRTEAGRCILKDKYKIWNGINEGLEFFEEKYFLVLDNNVCIEYY